MPQAGTTSGGATVYGQSSTGAATATPNTAAASSPTTTSVAAKFQATQGWYITGAIVTSVALANTAVGPILLGVLGLALIYQTSLLLQGK